MIVKINGKQERSKIVFEMMIWLLTLQSPLELVYPIFVYIDEAVALAGIIACGAMEIPKKKIRISKNTFRISKAIAIFVMSGLLGNILFQYQAVSPVLIDVFTNLKFFFSISAGYYFFDKMTHDEIHNSANKNARVITLMLFCIFLLDRFLNFYPGEMRYGIKSTQLFFRHPTYFAGGMGFLIIILTIFYEKKNVPYLMMAILMMAFSLRSKAIASAAVYIFLFIHIIIKNKRLSYWNLILCGILCIVIAWPLIQFYYIELVGKGTRSILSQVAFNIMEDYFPIGTGFGTYASAAANKNFSKVYHIYDLGYLLRFDGAWTSFLSDTFWPIIFAQTGFIGAISYVYVIVLLIKKCFAIQKINKSEFVGAIYVFVYLLVSSTSEPAFFNSVAIPMAFALGVTFRKSKV